METKIVLPADENLKRQLRVKLVEYRGRIDPRRPHKDQVSTYYKKAVLSRVLSEGEVNIQEMRREMLRVHGSAFEEKVFHNACGVINDYCRTGGANISGGTGLGSQKTSAVAQAFEQIAQRFLE